MIQTLATQDDQQLWQRLKAGNQTAMSAIFKKYYTDMFRYGCKLVRYQEELVRDCIQDLFVEIWDRRKQLGDVINVRSYLLLSLRRSLIRKIEKQRKLISNTDPQTEAAFEGKNDFELSIEELLIQQEGDSESNQRLKVAISKLSKTQKEIIFLRYYNNLDYKEIATITNTRYQSVRNNMYRALKSLRNIFGVFFGVFYFI